MKNYVFRKNEMLINLSLNKTNMISRRLARKGNVKVLNALLAEQEPLSIKKIAERAGISLSTAHSSVKQLLEEDVIKRVKSKPYDKYELNYKKVIPDWAQFDRGVFLVNVLAIVYNPHTKKILIGLRKNDPYIKQLSWVFPGGRPGYNKELEDWVIKHVKEKTGLKVKNPRIVFAKTYPEKREFLSVYYLVTSKNSQAKPRGGLHEVKWIRPTEVKKYFTTSLHPKVYEFLKRLEEGKVQQEEFY